MCCWQDSFYQLCQIVEGSMATDTWQLQTPSQEGEIHHSWAAYLPLSSFLKITQYGFHTVKPCFSFG